MADTKISALTALTGANVDSAADVLAIVDTDLTTTKKILVDELRKALLSQTMLTNSLGADVALSNTSNYFDGPSVAQGTTGIWYATGSVTLTDTAGAANIAVKLWDGTTVISSGYVNVNAASANRVVSLSGTISSPAANIKISCKDVTSTSGVIAFNNSGNSKDSTLSVFRIG